MQEGPRLPLFDDLPLAHDDDPVGHIRHDGKVVGDHQQPHAVFARQSGQQGEDLRLCGDIQRGGRLVRDQQTGAQGDGDGDHHPLALPAA